MVAQHKRADAWPSGLHLFSFGLDRWRRPWRVAEQRAIRSWVAGDVSGFEASRIGLARTGPPDTMPAGKPCPMCRCQRRASKIAAPRMCAPSPHCFWPGRSRARRSQRHSRKSGCFKSELLLSIPPAEQGTSILLIEHHTYHEAW